MNYFDEYRSKLMTPEQAVRCVKSGDWVDYGTNVCFPVLLDKALAAQGTKLDVVLELQVPEEILFTRLASRGRADDKPEVIRQRLVSYREQTAPLIDYYGKAGNLVSIDGTGTIEEVFVRVEKVLDALNKG